jgi:hypothetical protein
MSDDERNEKVDHAKDEMEALPPPHQTWEEYRNSRERQEQERLEESERSRREAAVRAAPRPLAADTAAVLLQATDDEALRDQIIIRLTADDLLLVLEKVADSEIKNKLVRALLAR